MGWNSQKGAGGVNSGTYYRQDMNRDSSGSTDTPQFKKCRDGVMPFPAFLRLGNAQPIAMCVSLANSAVIFCRF